MDTNRKTILIIFSTISYILGICAYLYPPKNTFAILCAICLCVFIFLKIIKPKYALILFLIFCLGFYNIKHSCKDYDELSNIHANNVELYGRVESIPTVTRSGTRAKFYLGVDEARINSKNYKIKDSKTLITINDPKGRFYGIQIGDMLKITGNLREPKKATNPSQFDYAKYLKYKDTFSILYSEGENYSVIKKADTFCNLEEFWWYILHKTDTTRENIIAKHAKYIKSPQLEILGGIVFGNEAINPPDEIKQSFINSGLLHLLAASGLNVALIFGIWWFIAQNIRLPYSVSIWTGIFFILLYTLMTGFPPSIVRATIMLLFVLLGKLIDRQSKPVALVFFVAFIMLLFNPKMLPDVGFQLSFVVTIGLICSIEPLTDKLDNINKKFIKQIKDLPKILKIFLITISPKSLLAIVLVPLCAQLYVAALQMYYFNTFTPWSTLANICVVPFIGIVSFLGFVSSILSLIPYLGTKIILLFDITVNPMLVLLVKISSFFSSLKNSIITTPSPSVIQIILFWSILILLAQNIKFSFKNKKLAGGFLLCIVLFCTTFIKIPDKNFEILFFDTGNSDCTLIKTPNDKYIMIDTGKLPYRGLSDAKIIIEEYLKDKNIKELELLIVTHFDADHCGGVEDILNDFKVKEIFIQNANPNEHMGKRIISKIKEKNIKCQVAKNNKIIYANNGFTIKTYVANLDKNKISKDKLDNENSIITLLEYKNSKALFMADMGVEGYDKIQELHNKINILKVGHHGAKNSLNEKMLKELKPKYSVILSGYNTYGHPHFKTLRLLKKSNSEILLTRDLGAIKISNCTDNGSCKIEHFDKEFREIIPDKN